MRVVVPLIATAALAMACGGACAAAAASMMLAGTDPQTANNPQVMHGSGGDVSQLGVPSSPKLEDIDQFTIASRPAT